MFDRDTIIVYLYKSRFISNYKYWYLYGETWDKVARIRSEQDWDTDRMIDMVINVADPKFN